MIKSMTGYGSSRKIIDNREISIEIRSVNHRYFELSCRVPREFSFLEEKIRAAVKNRLFRGKVDLYVTIGSDENEQALVAVNHGLASGYINALKELAQKYGISDDISVSLVSRYPDIFNVSKPEIDEEKLWNEVSEVLDEALGKLIDMRQAEGVKLNEGGHKRG